MADMPIILPEEVTEAIVRAAPLYEGEAVLKEWLNKHGVIYGQGLGFWALQSTAPHKRGTPLGKYPTYGEMLTAALEECKRQIELNHDADGNC